MAEKFKVWTKYGGRCAYCGQPLDINKMHKDHVIPRFKGGSDLLPNLMSACAPCNLWKKTLSVEEFREEIGKQIERVRRDSGGFRMAERYGLVKATGRPVRFFFEANKCF